jgi:arylsulfatase A-like enzyme
VPTNTLLIFATDNGALPTFNGARNTGLRGSKLSLYEGGTRLPFIARWPGRVPAARVDETSVLAAVDLLPTFASITGAKLPANYASDGEDVSAALLGKSFMRTKPIFWEYGRNEKSFAYPKLPDRSPNLALRDGPWKLLVNADGSGAELYDLLADPNETRSLVSTQPERAATMKASLLRWRRALPPPPPAP